jgi:hypothetical protein
MQLFQVPKRPFWPLCGLFLARGRVGPCIRQSRAWCHTEDRKDTPLLITLGRDNTPLVSLLSAWPLLTPGAARDSRIESWAQLRCSSVKRFLCQEPQVWGDTRWEDQEQILRGAAGCSEGSQPFPIVAKRDVLSRVRCCFTCVSVSVCLSGFVCLSNPSCS